MKSLKAFVISMICFGLICALEAYKFFFCSEFTIKALIWASQIDAAQFFGGIIFGTILSIPYVIWLIKDIKKTLNKNKRDTR